MVTGTTATSGTGAAGALTSTAGGKNASLDKVNFDTFLKLLVAQLKNQDPLNPLDGTQFTGQIAQFSSLEQQINGNNYLKEILAQRDFGEQTLANSYLDKEVLGPGNLLVKSGASTELGYKVGASARDVSVEIIENSTGRVVKTFQGDASEGAHNLVWNGKNDSGQAVADGKFTVKVTARDIDGKVVAAQPYVFGRVSSILNDNGAIKLQLSDGRSMASGDVLGVRI
jgi:flagellar basal-body rod modification protein FlgD